MDSMWVLEAKTDLCFALESLSQAGIVDLLVEDGLDRNALACGQVHCLPYGAHGTATQPSAELQIRSEFLLHPAPTLARGNWYAKQRMRYPGPMDPARLRSLSDVSLFEALKGDLHVRRVMTKIAEAERESPMQVRRQLLATALRLTPSMAPDTHAIVERCRERLAVEIPTEVYVYSDPRFNAACVKPQDGRLFIMLSSSLLQAFRGAELEFVIGHELGHYIFGHHDIPIGYLVKAKQPPSPELMLKLFSWSRYAEVSADRAGAHCAKDFDAVATALFRLASGLADQNLVRVRIEEFAGQVDEMILEGGDPQKRAPVADWFSTHPFSPLRVKTLERFSQSELAREDGMEVAELEAHVTTLMALMEPSYLDEKSDAAELKRRTLFAGAIAVADADGTISESEVAVFEKFFGQHAFGEKLDIPRITSQLDSRINDMKKRVSQSRRAQVVRDLCLVVRAGGEEAAKGRTVLESIARKLEVPEAIVAQTLSADLEMD